MPPGCGLWLSWFLVNILGAALGWILGWWTSFSVPGMLSTPALGATMGATLGLAQWSILRNRFRGSIWWLPASAFGWSAGFMAGVDLAQRFGLDGAWFGILAGLVTGAVLGLSQWLVLRTPLPGAGWWIPASSFAWASSLIYYRPGISGVGALFGILSGMVTGLALLWLLYKPFMDD